MGRHWKFLENLANRLGIWVTAVTAMTGFFGWVASHLVMFKPYGWAEAAFAGLFTALAIILILSVGMIAWRSFRPIPIAHGSDAAKSRDQWAEVSREAQDQAFKNALAHTNGRIDAWAKDLLERLNNFANGTAKQHGDFQGAIDEINRKITIDLPNASTIAEAYRNLDDATCIKIDRISEETQRFSEPVKSLERDVTRLVFFAADLATLAVLEGQIATGDPLEIPLGPDVEMSERTARRGQVTQFIQEVRSAYANTHRGMIVENVLWNAEGEATQLLKSPSERPDYIDLLEYRDLKIDETRRMRLLAFLKMQRSEKQAEIRRQRPDLLDRLSARNPS